jgi:hypothetical protein
MSSPARKLTSGEYVEWLRLAVHDKALPANNRVRAAASCLAIAQEHHHSIVLLMEHRLFASSFALLRIAYEAYVRGEWLSQCATDEQIEKFLEAWEPPKIAWMLAELEATPAFVDRVLSSLKQTHWTAMCAYTHTGGLHVQRWNTSEAVEPVYDQEEVDEVLYLAETLGSLSVIGVAELANDGELANKVLAEVNRRSK